MLIGMTFTAGKYTSAVHIKTAQPGDIRLNHQFWLLKKLYKNHSKRFITAILPSQLLHFLNYASNNFKAFCLFITTA
jgi:hypothetical protein